MNTVKYITTRVAVMNRFFSGEKIPWKQECKRKAAGSSEATVRNNELVFDGEGVCSELVTDVEESKYT